MPLLTSHHSEERTTIDKVVQSLRYDDALVFQYKNNRTIPAYIIPAEFIDGQLYGFFCIDGKPVEAPLGLQEKGWLFPKFFGFEIGKSPQLKREDKKEHTLYLPLGYISLSEEIGKCEEKKFIPHPGSPFRVYGIQGTEQEYPFILAFTNEYGVCFFGFYLDEKQRPVSYSIKDTQGHPPKRMIRKILTSFRTGTNIEATLKEELKKQEQSSPALFQEVVVLREYPREFTHQAARDLWDYLQKEGKILSIDDLSDEEPVVTFIDVDGVVIPTCGKIKVNKKGKEYVFAINENERYFTVGSNVPVEHAAQMDEDLGRCLSPIFRTEYSDPKCIDEFVEEITRGALHKVFPRNGRITLCVKKDLDVKYLDRTLRVYTQGHFVTCSFSRNEKVYVVEVAAPTPSVDSIVGLLQKQDKMQETGIGKGDALHTSKACSWDSLVGVEGVKKQLERYVLWPLQHSALFKAIDLEPPKGILLHGPPGTGKTTIAKILASETGSEFYAVKGADIMSQWFGESEKNVKKLFTQARSDAHTGKNVIIFIDDIDTMFTNRDFVQVNEVGKRIFGEFINEMDGFYTLERVMILAATNRPGDLDEALIRPGRFGTKIHVGYPTEQQRKEILKLYLQHISLDNVNIDKLAEQTENYTGAMLKKVCEEAKYAALERAKQAKKEVAAEDIVIVPQDFQNVIQKPEQKKFGFSVQ